MILIEIELECNSSKVNGKVNTSLGLTYSFLTYLGEQSRGILPKAGSQGKIWERKSQTKKKELYSSYS